jgi:hypothetical protein
MASADWSSLPAELVSRIADCFLATNDLDYFMDFRAVCQSWRSATEDPKISPDPLFRPRHWVIDRRQILRRRQNIPLGEHRHWPLRPQGTPAAP